MTEVVVAEALGESLSPKPGKHLCGLSCEVVLPLSDWLERIDNGCTGAGQSVS